MSQDPCLPDGCTQSEIDDHFGDGNKMMESRDVQFKCVVTFATGPMYRLTNAQELAKVSRTFRDFPGLLTVTTYEEEGMGMDGEMELQVLECADDEEVRQAIEEAMHPWEQKFGFKMGDIEIL